MTPEPCSHCLMQRNLCAFCLASMFPGWFIQHVSGYISCENHKDREDARDILRNAYRQVTGHD